MKNILVPFDFSKPAVNAFRLAVKMADKSAASVHLLYVIPLPVLTESIVPIFNFEGPYMEELKRNSEMEFIALKEKYKPEGENVQVDEKVEFGAISSTILDYIDVHSIDLVIMGSHGFSGLREVVIGSNAEKMVRTSPVPVLVIKNHFKDEIKNIVFPNTFEEPGQDRLMEKLKELQHFFQAKLHLVLINTPTTFLNEDDANSLLENCAMRYKLTDYTLHIYNYSNEEEGILHFAKKVNANMIAMGTHGRKGIAHLIQGSLAEDVTNHSDLLVWTYSLKRQSIGFKQKDDRLALTY
ncbi:MAG: universal stress protein UspA [Azospira oryzae]|nr:MAG: universal stress protein UspA [Azospira oryzae]